MASGCIPTVSPHLSQFEFGTLDCLHPCHKGSRTIMLAQCCYRYQSTPLQLVGTVAPYFFLMWIGKNSLILRSEHRIRPLNQVFCCEVSPNDCTPSPLFEQPFQYVHIVYSPKRLHIGRALEQHNATRSPCSTYRATCRATHRTTHASLPLHVRYRTKHCTVPYSTEGSTDNGAG